MKLQIALERGSLIIDPRPGERAFASTSVDLTLDPTFSTFKEFKEGLDISIDPARDGFDHDSVMDEITQRETISATDGYVLHPKRLILGWTAEYVDLRKDPSLAARVEGKSSLGRLGLGIHVTAPTIHAGFDGRIRLEIINHGFLPIKLRAGMRVCQLILGDCLPHSDRS